MSENEMNCLARSAANSRAVRSRSRPSSRKISRSGAAASSIFVANDGFCELPDERIAEKLHPGRVAGERYQLRRGQATRHRQDRTQTRKARSLRLSLSARRQRQDDLGRRLYGSRIREGSMTAAAPAASPAPPQDRTLGLGACDNPRCLSRLSVRQVKGAPALHR